MLNRYPLDLHIKATPAVRPPEHDGRTRDDVKLLAIDRKSGHVSTAPFVHLADFFQPGDLLVVNNSSTIPAALDADVGGQASRIHLAAHLQEHDVVFELRTHSGSPNVRDLSPDTPISILDQDGHPVGHGRVTRHFQSGTRFWVAHTESDWYQLAERVGRPIRYHYLSESPPIEAYQTFFGSVPGSSEMPSAGRPFTSRVVEALVDRGVDIGTVTLHTTVSSHEVYEGEAPALVPEWYRIPARTQAMLAHAQAQERPIIALGTTVVRALESWAAGFPPSGWTDHLVTPASPPRLVSGLITGLHDSFTSHLWLLYAFLDPAYLTAAYRQAEASGFRWHEFGDLSLIR